MRIRANSANKNLEEKSPPKKDGLTDNDLKKID